jgi:hypothetical protein
MKKRNGRSKKKKVIRKYNYPVVNQRYESYDHIKRFKEAAKTYHWSLNTFMNVAGQELYDRIIAEGRQKENLQEAEHVEDSQGNGPTTQPAASS